VPSPSKANALRVPPRMSAAILAAAVEASRVACCAVGGAVLPPAVLMEAQSPSAQT